MERFESKVTQFEQPVNGRLDIDRDMEIEGIRRLVVVGHGPTAHHFVEKIREQDSGGDWQITVIGEESQPAYNRVALTSYLTEEADLAYPAHDPDVKLLTGDAVVAIDRVDKKITTHKAKTIEYDTLVLATGSEPFVPPIEGRELSGVHVYRTVDDIDRLRSNSDELAESKDILKGVVIGGGLLGLEAARALQGMQMETSVIEAAPWLMSRQLDKGGGAMLKRHIEDLNMQVHAGSSIARFEADEDGTVSRVVMQDQSVIDADVVVISAGIRPRDELARSSGLPVGERGGIVVDESFQTEDPSIYAIGECALVNGTVHGLVAPCLSMAEVAADRLIATTQNKESKAVFKGADLSTKLKLMGVDVASFGDPLAGEAEGTLDITLNNPVSKTYKKLIITDNAEQKIVGGVLVGETSAYGDLRNQVGKPLSEEAEQLLFGDTSSCSAEGSHDTLVCSCHNVSAQAITDSITENSLTTVKDVKACTKAGTGCGSCTPMLKKILDNAMEASGETVDKSLCEHFDYSRAELFDITRVRGITSFSQLIEDHGCGGRGCDVCKPVAASILASQENGHILEGEQGALQDTNDHLLANIQKNGTYSVVPRVPGGEITPQKLGVIADVAKEFELYTKITGAQRIDLFGARAEQLPAIWSKLVDAGFESGHAYGKAMRTVKSCVGSEWCRYGVQDSVAMAIQLEERYRGLRSPHKLKAAVSGCARECAEAQSKDFGVIATEKGWNLYVGGNGGMKPRHAELFATDLDDDTLLRYTDRFVMFYIRTADRLQRTASWIEGLEGGINYLREVIIDDKLNICADLDQSMEKHVESYSDEWRGVLEDPDKLKRFVSFVNAPDTTDPTIQFEKKRDQIRPVEVAGLTLPVITQSSNLQN